MNSSWPDGQRRVYNVTFLDEGGEHTRRITLQREHGGYWVHVESGACVGRLLWTGLGCGHWIATPLVVNGRFLLDHPLPKYAFTDRLEAIRTLVTHHERLTEHSLSP